MQTAQPASTGTNQLFGRLIWNDDVTVRVFTPFGGRVRKILVQPGQRIDKDAPLAEIESSDFGQAQADIRRASSDVDLSDRTLARLRDLFAHGAAAQKDIDAAEAEAARAQAERSRAVSRLQVYGASAETVDGAFILKSPIAGTVVEKNINPGQEIRPDQMLANAPEYFAPLYVISDPSRLWIQIDTTEVDLSRLAPGRVFTFAARAFPGQVFTGRVDTVSDFIDPATRSIKVRGTVDNADRLLKAEMFVNVNLPQLEEPGAVVPAGAVILRGEKHYVFVAQNPSTFVRREVQLGAERNGIISVLSGVEPGQRIVTEGCILLQQMIE